MNEIVKADEKNDAYSRILRFYEKNDIVLTAEEEKIHARWIYCDALMRSRLHRTEEILAKIQEQHNVSKFTAQNDIRNSQLLFGLVRQLSKRYLLHNHIESIQNKIRQAETDKSLAPLLPKLYHELTLAINSLPDEIPAKDVPLPHVYIGSLTINNNEAPKLSIEEARAKWKAIKAKRNDSYIDHEDVKE